MSLNKYKWAALAAALFLPPVLLALTNKPARKTKAIKNLKAFLLMIQYAEGTIGKNAYRMLYGGNFLNDYSMHPNIAVTKWGITSTAAGAYQLLYKTWTGLQQALRLSDFSPASQDQAAIELIKNQGALTDVLSGNIPQAIYKCRKIWASFPGAGYGQNEKRLTVLLDVYKRAGGQLLNA